MCMGGACARAVHVHGLCMCTGYACAWAMHVLEQGLLRLLPPPRGAPADGAHTLALSANLSSLHLAIEMHISLTPNGNGNGSSAGWHGMSGPGPQPGPQRTASRLAPQDAYPKVGWCLPQKLAATRLTGALAGACPKLAGGPNGGWCWLAPVAGSNGGPSVGWPSRRDVTEHAGLPHG